MDVAVVDATADTIVALKPAGLPCEMPRDAAADSLVRRLERAGAGPLRLVHRLDAPACGLVLLARSRDAAAYYSAEIAARRWFKLYVARLEIAPASATRLVGSHKAYLRTVGSRAEVVRAGGKPSFLEVMAAAAVPDAPHASHALIHLQTGRFHQIRAMLAHAAAPLTGDVTYGGSAGRLYLEHVALAAAAAGSGVWTVWAASAHADRDRWAPALTAAVESAVAMARTSPPPRGPAR